MQNLISLSNKEKLDNSANSDNKHVLPSCIICLLSVTL